MNDLANLLGLAEQTAVSAGHLTKQKLNEPRQLTNKGFRDIVTDGDLAAQKLITDAILAAHPTHGFLPEEKDSSLPDRGDVIWVIDPIDGTTNYSHSFPLFCVSLGAVESATGKLLVGAIYDPLRRELFSAAAGQGAFVQEDGGEKRPLSTSSITNPAKANVGFDVPRTAELRQKTVDVLQSLAHEVQAPRNLGTAALALAWVAAGRLDCYFNYSLSAWDMAAATLLLQESGGAIFDHQKRPWSWELREATNCVASNGHLHEFVFPHLR